MTDTNTTNNKYYYRREYSPPHEAITRIWTEQPRFGRGTDPIALLSADNAAAAAERRDYLAGRTFAAALGWTVFAVWWILIVAWKFKLLCSRTTTARFLSGRPLARRSPTHRSGRRRLCQSRAPTPEAFLNPTDESSHFGSGGNRSSDGGGGGSSSCSSSSASGSSSSGSSSDSSSSDRGDESERDEVTKKRSCRENCMTTASMLDKSRSNSILDRSSPTSVLAVEVTEEEEEEEEEEGGKLPPLLFSSSASLPRENKFAETSRSRRSARVGDSTAAAARAPVRLPLTSQAKHEPSGDYSYDDDPQWQRRQEEQTTACSHTTVQVIVRGAFLVAGASFIAASILLVTAGATHLQSTVDVVNESAGTIHAVAAEAEGLYLTALTRGRFEDRAKSARKALLSDFSNATVFCPADHMSLPGTATHNAVDKVGKAAVLLRELGTDFLRDRRHDVFLLAQRASSASETVRDQSHFDISDGYLLAVLVPAVVVPCFLMGGTILAWADVSFPAYTCFADWILLPLLVFMVIIACLLQGAFAMGAGINSDICMPGGQANPDATVRAAAEEAAAVNGGMYNSSTYYLFYRAAVEWYTSQCDETLADGGENPFQPLQEYQSTLIANRDSLQQLLVQVFRDNDVMQELSTDCGRSYAGMLETVNTMAELLETLHEVLQRTLQLFDCHRIVPAYTNAVYDGACTHCWMALTWTYFSALAMSCSGLAMITLRASYRCAEDDDGGSGDNDGGVAATASDAAAAAAAAVAAELERRNGVPVVVGGFVNDYDTAAGSTVLSDMHDASTVLAGAANTAGRTSSSRSNKRKQQRRQSQSAWSGFGFSGSESSTADEEEEEGNDDAGRVDDNDDDDGCRPYFLKLRSKNEAAANRDDWHDNSELKNGAQGAEKAAAVICGAAEEEAASVVAQHVAASGCCQEEPAPGPAATAPTPASASKSTA